MVSEGIAGETGLTALFAAAGEPLALIDGEGRIARANAALGDALGLPDTGALTGRELSTLACTECRPAVGAAVAALAKAAGTRRLPLTCGAEGAAEPWLDCTLTSTAPGGPMLAQLRDVTEARRTTRHRRAVERLTGVGSWEVDLATGRLLWSRRVFEIHGLDPDSDEPDTPATLACYAEGGRETLRTALARLTREGTPFDLELPLAPGEQDQRWVRATGGADMAEGRVLRTYGTVEDVTETRAERAHHRRLATIAENTVNGVLVTDPQGLTEWVNPTFTWMTGYTLDELRGRTPGEVLQCEDTDPATVARLAAAIAAREPVSVEILNRSKDGRDYWVSMDIAPMHDTEGALTGFMAIETDITEKKAAQAEHARAERLGRIVESGLTEVYVFDAESLRFLEVNHGARENLGYSAAELAGMTPLDIKPDHDAATFAELLAPLRSGAQDLLRFRTRHRRRDGSTYPAEIHLELMDDTPGVFIATVLDVSDREAAERAAREAWDRLVTAVESLPDGFVLYDSEDRLMICNERYREMYSESAPAMVPGAPFEDILRYGLARGQYADALGREEEWLAERLAAHRAAEGTVEQQLADGRWLRILERMTPDGGRVGLRIDITEQLASRARAEQAEARLRDAIDALPAAFWLFDADDRLVMYNDTYATLFPISAPALRPGITYEEYVRYGLARGEYPHAVGREEEWVAQLMADRASGHYTREYRLESGRHIKSYNDRTSDGGMVGFRVDVTEEAESRARAERAEARLRDAIEALPAAFWLFDADDRLVLYNERYLEFFPESAPAIETGARFEDMIRRGLAGGEFPDAVGREEAWLAEVLERRRRGSYSLEYPTKGGRWIKAYNEPTRDGGMVGFRVDLTELKRREDDLTAALAERDAAEQRFFDIASVSADWFWEQDTDLRFTFLSESFERTTGGRIDLHIGKTRAELMVDHPESRDSADFDWLDARYAARERFSDFVYRSFAHSDREVWVRISGAPFYDAEGNFAGYRGVGSDVTALYSAMRQAEEANRSKSTFLANMSHEIRTPMNGILGVAEILDAQVSDPEHKRLVATMRDSGEVLMNILNDILDVSKIEAGKLELDAQPFRPVDLARRVEALHTDRASAKGISLAVMTGRDAEQECLGDGHRILQVLNNLVSNAIKFTEAGEVSVSLRGGGDRPLLIEVRDTGIGMSEEQIARIFDDFVQADSSTTRRFGGTGLGMAIVRKLIEAMGGDVDLNSRPGAGTLVRVTLPVAPGASRPAVRPATAPGPADGTGLGGVRVLAADDNRTNRLVLQAMLHSLGTEATIVETGEAAVEACADTRFDVLLLDISMPGLDGIETLAALRAQEARAGLPPTPALAVTANAMKHQIALYLGQGFAGHIAKPIRSADLAAAITTALAKAAAPGGRGGHLAAISGGRA